MPKPKKNNVEFELEIARMNAKDLRTSNQRLLKQLDDKNFELIAKDQEIHHLKSMVANEDATVLKPIRAKTVPHTHHDQQLAKSQVRKYLDDQEMHNSGWKSQEYKSSPEPGRHINVIQELSNQKEALEQTCLQSANKINELENELLRVLHENEVQHSRLEDYLEEKALLSRRYDHLSECYQKLQAENTKATGLNKRRLATYLSDIGFSKDDFAKELEHSPFKTPFLKDNLNEYSSSHVHGGSSQRSHAAVPNIKQPDTPVTKFGLNMKEAGDNKEYGELNEEKDTLNSHADDNTIVVARKVKENTPHATQGHFRAATGVEIREMDTGVNEETDEQTDEDTDERTDEDVVVDDADGDVEIEGAMSESEPETASEYNPENDWDMEAGSDRGLSSAEDSDYAP